MVVAVRVPIPPEKSTFWSKTTSLEKVIDPGFGLPGQFLAVTSSTRMIGVDIAQSVISVRASPL